MRDEMCLHIELEADRLRNNGLDPDEARLQAHVRFGGIEKFKEEDATPADSRGSTPFRSTHASVCACSRSTDG